MKRGAIRYFKRRSLGKIFEIALDLFFHLPRHALLERIENFLAEIARSFVFFFAGQAEFFCVEPGETLFKIELGKLWHTRQRRQATKRHETAWSALAE